jgi:hypothetical protein
VPYVQAHLHDVCGGDVPRVHGCRCPGRLRRALAAVRDARVGRDAECSKVAETAGTERITAARAHDEDRRDTCCCVWLILLLNSCSGDVSTAGNSLQLRTSSGAGRRVVDVRAPIVRPSRDGPIRSCDNHAERTGVGPPLHIRERAAPGQAAGGACGLTVARTFDELAGTEQGQRHQQKRCGFVHRLRRHASVMSGAMPCNARRRVVSSNPIDIHAEAIGRKDRATLL